MVQTQFEDCAQEIVFELLKDLRKKDKKWFKRNFPKNGFYQKGDFSLTSLLNYNDERLITDAIIKSSISKEDHQTQMAF